MRIDRMLACAAFVAAAMATSGVGAFEMTRIGGAGPDGSAQYQDPDDKALSTQFGKLQMGVEGSGVSENNDADAGAPPWQLKPSPASPGFFSSPYGGPSSWRR